MYQVKKRLVENVLLLHIESKRTKRFLIQENIQEMERLIKTSGGKLSETLLAKIERPTPATYIGKGKLEELKQLTKGKKFDLVVVNIELSPTQMRNLEEKVKVRVVDRTGLILDIFAFHARTKEGKLQIELAQLIYTLPRLGEMWEELSKQGGGGIGMRGPGEHQIEADRRKIRKKISSLKKELENVRAHRSRVRSQRKRQNQFTISLVGYTNAGKSTLLNQMTGAEVLAEDKLFATLDPTTRQLRLPNQEKVLLSDTVGFLKQLPHTLIEAFKATLEEIKLSDLIFEVIDSSDPFFEDKQRAVKKVLEEIKAGEIPRVKVFNKIDSIKPDALTRLKRDYPHSIFISALKGDNKPELRTFLENYISSQKNSNNEEAEDSFN